MGNAVTSELLSRGVKVKGKVTEIVQRLKTKAPIKFGLEQPLPWASVGAEVEFRGWVLTDSSEPRARLLFTSGLAIPLMLDRGRPDVDTSFKSAPSVRARGFEQRIPWSEISSALDPVQFTVEVQSGDDVFLTGPYTISRREIEQQPSLLVQVEQPSANESFAQSIPIVGWLINAGQAPTSTYVEVYSAAGIKRFSVEPSIDRPDVVDTLGLRPTQSVQCGFSRSISWREIGDNIHEASVSLVVVSGAQMMRFGPFRVFKTISPILSHQRGSYKEVWNSGATEPDVARAAVAGIFDEQEFTETGRSSAQTIGDMLQVSADDTVLEIGCGVGRIGRFLAPRCKKWIGSDISGNMLEHARKHLGDIPNYELVELAANDLGEFTDNSIDKLYCSVVFTHLDEWDRFNYVREAFRVLRPGGRAYFDGINLMGEIGWEVFMQFVGMDSAKRPAAAGKTSTPEELLSYLRRAGFLELDLRPGDHFVAVAGVKPSADSQAELVSFYDPYPPAHIFATRR